MAIASVPVIETCATDFAQQSIEHRRGVESGRQQVTEEKEEKKNVSQKFAMILLNCLNYFVAMSSSTLAVTSSSSAAVRRRHDAKSNSSILFSFIVKCGISAIYYVIDLLVFRLSACTQIEWRRGRQRQRERHRERETARENPRGRHPFVENKPTRNLLMTTPTLSSSVPQAAAAANADNGDGVALNETNECANGKGKFHIRTKSLPETHYQQKQLLQQ